MHLFEKSLKVNNFNISEITLKNISRAIYAKLGPKEIPVRFVITNSDMNKCECELGILSTESISTDELYDIDIFEFRKREMISAEKFNIVHVVPTGVGAEIGGHSGDAGAVAKLLASTCDTLITHPNVVNASDINELPENGLYVEGSVITRLMMGTIGLQPVRNNRVLAIVDGHEDKLFSESAVNAVSAARATMGMDSSGVVIMEDRILMHSLFSDSGRAVGRIEYFERICDILNQYHGQYDAVALTSVIKVPEKFHVEYYLNDMVNPWGGVEAMLTHAISLLYDIPAAHSPMLESREILDLDLGIVDPRKAAEIISVTFLHSVLKGLHKSPGIVKDTRQFGRNGVISAEDVSCLLIPYGCLGLPVIAALEQGMPVIAVAGNKNRMNNKFEDLPWSSGQLIVVENYLEAAGVLNALKSGVTVDSILRPLLYTDVSYHRFSGSSALKTAERIVEPLNATKIISKKFSS